MTSATAREICATAKTLRSQRRCPEPMVERDSGLELIGEIDAQGFEGGSDAGDESREEGEDKREGESATVERDVGPAGHVAGDAFGHEDKGEAEVKPAEDESAACSDEAEEDVFSEELAKDAGAACAERGAHGDFSAALDAARELEVGDVGADDEEHEERGAHDEAVVERGEIAVDGVEKGFGVHGPTAIGGGIGAGELGGDGAEVRLGLLDGDALAQASFDEVVTVAAVGDLLRGGREGKKDVGFRGILHGFGSTPRTV